LRKKHVRVDGDALVFDYDAKGGMRRVISIMDAEVLDLVRALKRRRGGQATVGDELLAYKDGSGRWRDVKSADLNEHLPRRVRSNKPCCACSAPLNVEAG
jgi:DNA topoisomerase IB